MGRKAISREAEPLVDFRPGNARQGGILRRAHNNELAGGGGGFSGTALRLRGAELAHQNLLLRRNFRGADTARIGSERGGQSDRQNGNRQKFRKMRHDTDFLAHQR